MQIVNLSSLLSTAFPNETFQSEYPLAEHTYSKIGGNAQIFFTTSSPDTLAQVIAFCHNNSAPLTMLGGGSNVLISDSGIRGVVCSFTGNAIEVTEVIADTTVLTAQAGTKMAALVTRTTGLELTGLEYFLGVPGTLGGAVYNNSHYLNELIGSHITQVEIISEAGERKWLSQQECLFGYDSSRFHHTSEVIITVEFSLMSGDPKLSQEKIKEAIEYRARTQPLGTPSSGCIFKNTPNTPELKKLFPQFANQPLVPTGFIIDQAGLKGCAIGGIQVSEKHAAWLLNTGGGTQKEVRLLIEKIKTTVRDKYGVELQEEVMYLE